MCSKLMEEVNRKALSSSELPHSEKPEICLTSMQGFHVLSVDGTGSRVGQGNRKVIEVNEYWVNEV